MIDNRGNRSKKNSVDPVRKSAINPDQKLEEVLEIAHSWVLKCVEDEIFFAAFLFGSAVNENGIRFESSRSDLDIIVVIDWDDDSPSSRVVHLKKIQEEKKRLEYALLCALARSRADDPIVSLLPLSNLELRFGIHKGGNREILSSTKVIDLVTRNLLESIVPNGDLMEADNHIKKTLEFVQKCRSEFLFIGANGSGGLEMKDHKDPIPKELMRHFAVAVHDNSEFSDNATDLSRGLSAITSHFSTFNDTDPGMASFGEWLDVKRGARGKVDDRISIDHYLLVVETIFEKIRNKYDSRVRSKITFSADKSPQTGASGYSLPSLFVVTTSNRLSGSSSDKRKNVAAARANMGVGIDRPFSIEFEEYADSIQLMQKSQVDLTIAEHKKLIKIFERQEFIAKNQGRLYEGIWLILYYGATLFPLAGKQLDAFVASAIDSWINHWSTGFLNIGGKWEAWHELHYPPFAFSFSADGGTDGDRYSHTLYVNEFSENILCKSFVPELVSKYLRQKNYLGRDISDEMRHDLFAIGFWRYGLR